MGRLRGEGVTVWRPTTTYDSAYDPIETWVPEHVDNVLWGRPTTEQADATMRAYGVDVAYTLGIPKGYTASLRGCRITRDRDEQATTTTTTTGGEPSMGWPAFAVVGDPQPLPPEICPTPWNREAHVGWVDG